MTGARRLEDVTVVVLNWNLPGETVECVQALVRDGVPERRIVLVDNASTDDSWLRFQAELPRCHLVRSSVNRGFARGVNLGARVLPGTNYLIVNNDAFVHAPGSVAAMLAELDREGVAIVAPLLRNHDLSIQPSVMPFMTPRVAIARASGLSRLIPDRYQPSWSTHWSHARSRAIQTVNGGVLLVRGDVWEALGGFDESTFMYGEDHDLCWRAARRGLRTWYSTRAEFVHVGGGSPGARWEDPGRAERVAFAEAALLRRHLSRSGAAASLFFIKAGLAARLLVLSVVGRPDAARTCRGWLRGYAGVVKVPSDWESSDVDVEVLPPRSPLSFI